MRNVLQKDKERQSNSKAGSHENYLPLVGLFCAPNMLAIQRLGLADKQVNHIAYTCTCMEEKAGVNFTTKGTISKLSELHDI